MSDVTCPRCGDDNISDYPVCDECATVAHFTHRARCIHCERKRAAASEREAVLIILRDLTTAYSDHPLAGRAAALLARMGER